MVEFKYLSHFPVDHLAHSVVSRLILLPLICYIIIIIIISLLESFSTSVRWWSFTGVWLIPSHQKFPGLFFVFWLISIIPKSGWSPVVIWFLSLPVYLPSLWGLFRAHTLQLVSLSTSCYIVFYLLFYSFENFSHQHKPMVSHWRMIDKSLQLSKTFQRILADLNNAVVWVVTIIIIIIIIIFIIIIIISIGVFRISVS